MFSESDEQFTDEPEAIENAIEEASPEADEVPAPAPAISEEQARQIVSKVAEAITELQREFRYPYWD